MDKKTREIVLKSQIEWTLKKPKTYRELYNEHNEFFKRRIKDLEKDFDIIKDKLSKL